MNNLQVRVPLIALQNKRKNENYSINSKSKDKINEANIDPFKINNLQANNNKNNSNITVINQDNFAEKLINYSNLSIYGYKEKESEKLLLSKNEIEDIAKEEHFKCTIKALKESIEENEILRDRLKTILEENEDLKTENIEKTNALYELAEFYEVD